MVPIAKRTGLSPVWIGIVILCIGLVSFPKLMSAVRLNFGALALTRGAIGEASDRYGQLETAIDHLRQVQPAVEYTGEVERLIGLALLLQQRTTEAIQQFERAQQLGSRDAQVNLGNLYLEQKAWRQAVAKLDTTVCPDYLCIDRYVAKLLAQNQRTEAIDLLTAYVDAYPTVAGTPYYRLYGEYRGSKSDEVLRDLLKQGLNADPRKDATAFRYYSAMLKSLEGNDAEAIKILTELTNSDPAYYPAFHHLGYLFLKAGEPGKAADLFEKALQIDPTREWTHYYLSSAYLQLNRPLDAANQLWQSVRLAPRNKTFLERLLWVYKQNEMTCFEQQVLRLEQMTATGEAIDFAKEYSRIAQQCH